MSNQDELPRRTSCSSPDRDGSSADRNDAEAGGVPVGPQQRDEENDSGLVSQHLEAYTDDLRERDEAIRAELYDPVLQEFPEPGEARRLGEHFYDISTIEGIIRKSENASKAMDAGCRRPEHMNFDVHGYGIHPILGAGKLIPLSELRHARDTVLSGDELLDFIKRRNEYKTRAPLRKDFEHQRRCISSDTHRESLSSESKRRLSSAGNSPRRSLPDTDTSTRARHSRHHRSDRERRTPSSHGRSLSVPPVPPRSFTSPGSRSPAGENNSSVQPIWPGSFALDPERRPPIIHDSLNVPLGRPGSSINPVNNSPSSQGHLDVLPTPPRTAENLRTGPVGMTVEIPTPRSSTLATRPASSTPSLSSKAAFLCSKIASLCSKIAGMGFCLLILILVVAISFFWLIVLLLL